MLVLTRGDFAQGTAIPHLRLLLFPQSLQVAEEAVPPAGSGECTRIGALVLRQVQKQRRFNERASIGEVAMQGCAAKTGPPGDRIARNVDSSFGIRSSPQQ